MSDNTITQDELQLRDYELTVIYAPDVTEEQLETYSDGIRNYVTQNGGEIIDTQRWGKRRLAYPIKHVIDGQYIYFTFKMKPEDGKELENDLRITQEVLRHLLISKE